MDASESISVIGLGYVGLPVALAFSSITEVVAYDTNSARINELKAGKDHTGCLTQTLPSQLLLTNDPKALRTATFHIICVPTPIDKDNQPDLSFLESAAHTLGPMLHSGDTVVVESTVYPGVTEDIIVPILESHSGLKMGSSLRVGYSPERLSPSDTLHLFENTVKLVGANDYQTAELIAEKYRQVVLAGVHMVPSIKVAEAAKLLENTQRDVNIALVNEMAMLFHALEIDSHEVIEAAKTKWNFHPYEPGLVGGHCIGVDPYYMSAIAQRHGLNPDLVLSARSRNESMGEYVAQKTIDILSDENIPAKAANVGVFGLSFKENCPDIRNTKVVGLIQSLEAKGVKTYVADPIVNKPEFEATYNIKVLDLEQLPRLHAIVIAVAHDTFVHCSPTEYLAHLQHPNLLIDVKGHLDRDRFSDAGVRLWRL